jgi:hypothetical protein
LWHEASERQIIQEEEMLHIQKLTCHGLCFGMLVLMFVAARKSKMSNNVYYNLESCTGSFAMCGPPTLLLLRTGHPRSLCPKASPRHGGVFLLTPPVEPQEPPPPS